MIVGIETGGTKVVCAVSAIGSPDAPQRVESFPTTGPATTLQRIVDYIDGTCGTEGPEAIGIASFGPLGLDRDSTDYGRLLATPKSGWDGANVLVPLQRFGVPVALMTDVTGAHLGERRWGAARGVATSAYLTVGTGIGAGIEVEDRVIAGSGYPEIGHLPVARHPHDGFAGHCRLHGDCVEGLASGPAIRARWGAELPELGATKLAAALEFEAFYLAQVVASLHYTAGIGTVVMGGGVANWPGMHARVSQAAVERIRGVGGQHAGIRVVPPVLGGNAGVVGALTAAEDLVARAIGPE